MAGETAGRLSDLYMGSSQGSTGLAVVAKMRNGSVTGTNNLITVTNNDSSGADEFIDGITNHTGSFEHVYFSTDVGKQVDVLVAFSSGGNRWFDYRPTASTEPSWAGLGFVRTFTVGGPTDDADILTAEIQFSGAVTFST